MKEITDYDNTVLVFLLKVKILISWKTNMENEQGTNVQYGLPHMKIEDARSLLKYLKTKRGITLT